MIIRLSKEVMGQYVEQLLAIDNNIYHKMGHMYSTEMWSGDNFLCDRQGKWKYSLISIDNDKVEGCVIVTEYTTEHLHINRFFVKPEKSGIGVGRQLVANLMGLLKGNEVKEINLFVSVINKNAIKFYEHNGFVCMQDGNLKEIMEKTGRDSYTNYSFFDENNYEYFAYKLQV